MSAPYRRARLLAFLDPWTDPATPATRPSSRWSASLAAASLGVGLGESRAKWGFLPDAHTDFIFAIIGEELGLLGAFVVVALFVALGVLGLQAARRAPGPLRHAARHRHHRVVLRPGVRQHRRRRRRAADHRRAAAVRLVRRLVAGGHHGRRPGCCSTSPAGQRRPPPRRAGATAGGDAT